MRADSGVDFWRQRVSLVVLLLDARWLTLFFRYTRTGQGELVEKIYRDVMGARIPGGSEDVMLDLAVRQLVKLYEKGLKGQQKL